MTYKIKITARKDLKHSQHENNVKSMGSVIHNYSIKFQQRENNN
jgi:hypothetical protein